ncbi:MAG: hypothetical protein FWD66_06035 [Paludibacter sp.]|nr:hypothetical protein [Paludibacter sp.]
MNRIEQYIHENKILFEQEPPSGHWERMQQKMNQKPHRRNFLRWSMSIAASAAIICAAGFVFQYIKKTNNSTTVCENASDMKSCYLSKMNLIAGKIATLTKDMNPEDQQQVLMAVKSIIDMAQSGIESEIPKELPNTETRSIVSDYYRQNLESLESIEQRLKN